MKKEEAKILLQKYFEAETSIEEERSLAAYFMEEDIPEEMQPFRTWFESLESGKLDQNRSFAEESMEKVLRQEKQDRSSSRTIWISVSGIAASLLIVLGGILYYGHQPSYRDTFDDPAVAIAYAEKTMFFVSTEYNKGLAHLAPVHQLKKGTANLGTSIKTIEKGFAQINKIQLVNKLK